MDELEPARNFIKAAESCRLGAYRDSVGVWTIGWGHTEGVHPGQVITQEQADALLEQDMAERLTQMKQMVTTLCTNNQWCALLSLVFNIGVRAFYHSTLLRLLNHGGTNLAVAKQFLVWDHAGGRISAGLVERRKLEAALYLKG